MPGIYAKVFKYRRQILTIHNISRKRNGKNFKVEDIKFDPF